MWKFNLLGRWGAGERQKGFWIHFKHCLQGRCEGENTSPLLWMTLSALRSWPWCRSAQAATTNYQTEWLKQQTFISHSLEAAGQRSAWQQGQVLARALPGCRWPASPHVLTWWKRLLRPLGSLWHGHLSMFYNLIHIFPLRIYIFSYSIMNLGKSHKWPGLQCLHFWRKKVELYYINFCLVHWSTYINIMLKKHCIIGLGKKFLLSLFSFDKKILNGLFGQPNIM